MSRLAPDLRFALRTLAQRPGFSVTVVFTLALGIGAATIVFDIVNLVSWRRPPVERPRELVAVYRASQHPFIGPYGLSSFPDYEDYRDAGSFAGLAAFSATFPTFDSGEVTQEVEAQAVTGDFFDVLGIHAALGRHLTVDDDRLGQPPVAVLGYDLWRRLGADPAAVGDIVRLAGFPLTVVGIAPEGFHGLISGSRVGMYFPSHLVSEIGDAEAGLLTDRGLQRWNMIGRLAPGATPGQAAAELAARAERLDREHPIPGTDQRRVTVEPATLGHPIDRKNLRPTLRLFSAAVALLVLIVCANVANLLLSRAAGRHREMGIRQALGAGRRRLVRQLLTESLVLALAGGLGGLLLAFWMRGLMVSNFGEEFVGDMRFDHRVLGLALLATLVVTLVFGLAPAIATSRVNLVAALKDTVAGGGRRRLTAGPLLAVAQVALSLVLLASAAALVDGLWRARGAELGFDTENLLLARVDVSQGRHSREEGREIFRRLEERARSLPGVRSAGTAVLVPPIFLDVNANLKLPEDPETIRTSRLNFVSTSYFETLGLPLLQGRLFEPHDAESGRGVVVINRALADELWPGEEAIGRQVRVERSRPGDPGPDYVVIGVVADVTQHSASRAPEPVIYFDRRQRYRPNMDLVIRTEGGDPAAVFDALRQELRRIDPNLALGRAHTHDEHRWNALVEQRLQTQTVALFGLAGLVLALLGVFGVTSYAVSRRTREIGIRMALGARRRDVLGHVLRHGLTLALGGVGLGLVGAFWASRLLRGTMSGVVATHPGILAAAAVVLLATAAAAVALPARRASRIDPLTALRYE